MTPLATAVTSWDQLPLVLLVPEVARVMRRAPGTILRDCRLGTMRPRPFAVRPYRWHKETLRAFVEQADQMAHGEVDPRQLVAGRRKRGRR